MTGTNRKDYYLRFQPNVGSRLDCLMSYLFQGRDSEERRERLLEALKAFYEPFALEKVGYSAEAVRRAARQSIFLLRERVADLEKLTGDLPHEIESYNAVEDDLIKDFDESSDNDDFKFF